VAAARIEDEPAIGRVRWRGERAHPLGDPQVAVRIGDQGGKGRPVRRSRDLPEQPLEILAPPVGVAIDELDVERVELYSLRR
jgi:hypothetical protein